MTPPNWSMCGIVRCPPLLMRLAAMAQDAPQLWDIAPGNISYRFQKGDRAAVDAAFGRRGARS